MADYVLEWPLAGNHIITAGWFYSGGSLHQAIDMRVSYRQPVLAAGSGVVNFTYSWNGRVTNGDTNSYGNCLKILHDEKYNGSNIETLYAHLDSYCVRKGQRVKAGDIIGYAGYTGHVIPAGINGKHLHFEVRMNGRRTNPLVWLDNKFSTKDSSVFTFRKGERSAIRSSAPTPTPTPIVRTLTLKNGSWNVRRGAGTGYRVATVIRSPRNGRAVTLQYTAVVNGWYKTAYGYIGPAAVQSHT